MTRNLLPPHTQRQILPCTHGRMSDIAALKQVYTHSHRRQGCATQNCKQKYTRGKRQAARRAAPIGCTQTAQAALHTAPPQLHPISCLLRRQLRRKTNSCGLPLAAASQKASCRKHLDTPLAARARAHAHARRGWAATNAAREASQCARRVQHQHRLGAMQGLRRQAPAGLDPRHAAQRTHTHRKRRPEQLRQARPSRKQAKHSALLPVSTPHDTGPHETRPRPLTLSPTAANVQLKERIYLLPGSNEFVSFVGQYCIVSRSRKKQQARLCSITPAGNSLYGAIAAHVITPRGTEQKAAVTHLAGTRTAHRNTPRIVERSVYVN